MQKIDSIFVLPPLEQLHNRPWTSDVLRDPLISFVSLAASPDIDGLPSVITWNARSPSSRAISLAASSDIVKLQKKYLDIEKKLQSTWALADQGAALRNAVQGLSRLKDLLYASFEAEPLEDGIDHPAEDIIGDAIRSTNEVRVLDWLSGACLDSEHPTFSASILRCLGRQAHLGTESWRTELVSKALTVDDAEIRDAALQAAEFWGGLSMLDILKIKVKTEPLQWLRNYMQDVIEDLK